MTVSEDFTGLTGRFRGELLAHCYRMLGSAADAEDLVQETYLRAWRSYDGFGGRSSVRTWLYRIATNACLTALASRSRRRRPVTGVHPKCTRHATSRRLSFGLTAVRRSRTEIEGRSCALKLVAAPADCTVFGQRGY